jgi:hypothetical protein
LQLTPELEHAAQFFVCFNGALADTPMGQLDFEAIDVVERRPGPGHAAGVTTRQSDLEPARHGATVHPNPVVVACRTPASGSGQKVPPAPP